LTNILALLQRDCYVLTQDFCSSFIQENPLVASLYSFWEYASFLEQITDFVEEFLILGPSYQGRTAA
jgi:hypothetical protein